MTEMFALLFVMWGLGFIAGRKTAPKVSPLPSGNAYLLNPDYLVSEPVPEWVQFYEEPQYEARIITYGNIVGDSEGKLHEEWIDRDGTHHRGIAE